MRHRNNSKMLGRSSAHRKALMASLVSHLIEQKRIETSLAKAKQARVLAERMVTLARKGTLAARRHALSQLASPNAVAILFDEIAAAHAARNGGYTRIVRLGPRPGDGTEMAILEWMDTEVPDRKKKPKPAEKA